MKIFQTYINPSALVPRTIIILVYLVVGLLVSLILLLFLAPKHQLILAILIVLIVLFVLNLNIQSKVTKYIYEILFIIYLYCNKIFNLIKERPFLFCHICVIGNLLLIAYLLLKVKSIGYDNLKLDTSNTLAIRMLATFIPFIFTAFAYSKNKLSVNLSEKVTDTCFGSEFNYTVISLSLLYVLSIMSPLFIFQGINAGIFQLALLIACFISSGALIYAILRLSNKLNALKYFRIIETRKLKLLFLKDCSHLPLDGAILTNVVITYITGLNPSTLNKIASPMTPDEDCIEAAKSASNAFLSTLNHSVLSDKPVEEFAFCMNEWSEYLSNYFIFRKHYADTSDNVNLYVISELKKTIEICSDKKNEKYLESMIFPLRRIMLAACHHRGIGMSDDYNGLTYGWIDFIRDTIFISAKLENTSYPVQIINVLGDVACEDLRQKHHINHHVEQLSNIGMVLFKSKLDWHKIIAGICLEQLNKVLPTYIESWLNNPIEDYFIDTWRKSYTSLLASGTPQIPNTGRFYNNYLSSIYTTLRRLDNKTLPWSYNETMAKLNASSIDKIVKQYPHMSKEVIENIIWEKRIELSAVHGIYDKLLSSKEVFQENLISNDAIHGLVIIFFIDFKLSLISDADSAKEWQDKIIDKYDKIFNTISGQIISNINTRDHYHILKECLNTFMGIPALALTFHNDKNIIFTDEIVNKLSIQLCNIIQTIYKDKSDGQYSRHIKSYLLLLGGWLNITNRCVASRELIESTLAQYPSIRRSRRSSFFMPSDYSSYGLPGGHMSYDEPWYLFPCTFWERTDIQDRVKQKLMKVDDLVNYAKGIVKDED